jgi:hypothetical protein
MSVLFYISKQNKYINTLGRSSMNDFLRNILFSFILVLLVTGCNNSQNQEQKSKIMNSIPSISDTTIKALQTVGNSQIFFGHQSVGANVLNGMQSLAKKTGQEVNIEKIGSKPLNTQNVFAHSNIGENTDPKAKIDDFANQIRNLGEFNPEVAFMKFCYVDFTADSNIQEVFNYYRNTMETLKKERPDITFVHLTVPLSSKSYTIKSRVKEIIGRRSWNDDVTNAKRGEFNNLVLETFSSEPVFDIARIESTYPDGSRESFVKDKKTFYRMVPEYTTDGGHLNALGQQLIAKKMVEFLSEVINKK